MSAKTTMAYGVELDHARYRLRLARYPAMVASLEYCLSSFDPYPDGRNAQHFNILDVGVGHSRTFKYADHAGIGERFHWHGIDITHRPAPDKLAGTDRWTFRQANIDEGIPYPSAHFDVVVSEQILEHLHNVDFAIGEMNRITRGGGYLIIGVPIFTCPIAWLRNAYIKHLPGVFAWTGSGHVQSFCKRSIKKRIEADGSLEVLETRGFRIISGGVLRPLENFRWWYRFSCWLGRLIPGWCTEIQMLVRKRDGASPNSGA